MMNNELRMMNDGRRFLTIYRLPSAVYLLFSLFVIPPSAEAAGANSPWGTADISVGVAIQQGTAISAWDSADRANISSGIAWATPVGDGTYEIRVDLVPNAVYNYLFFASATAVNSQFARSAEPVPNSGADAGTFLSLSSTTITAPGSGSVGYGTAGNNEGRRILQMPDLAPGTTLYVFNNYASTPTGVSNYSATVISSQTVRLTWRAGLGYWGNTTPAYDTLGGNYMLFRSTTNSSGPYQLLATLSGITTIYTDTNLQTGVTAYYIFVSSDSYNGPTNPANKELFANLRRLPLDTTPQAGEFDTNEFTKNDKFAKPAFPVRTIFKVENLDEEYVQKNGGLVYMTPWDEDGKIYPAKVVGSFISVRVVESKKENWLVRFLKRLFRNEGSQNKEWAEKKLPEEHANKQKILKLTEMKSQKKIGS